MGMSADGFLRRLQQGKTVNCVYKIGDRVGLITAWRHFDELILTWEECREGEQYNESDYTRDDRYRFATSEQLLAFLEQVGYPASCFTP